MNRTSESHIALANPIWEALGTLHGRFAVSLPLARRFHPEVSPLAGVSDPRRVECWEELARLIPASVFYFEEELRTGPLVPQRDVGLLQMVAAPGASPDVDLTVGRDLTPDDVEAMLALVRLTVPGPMEPRTRELGHYLGIHDEAGNLIAMAGERLRVPGYTEISAVCTHPDHQGRGLARALIVRLVAEIRARGETPFLHLAESNTGAQKLYQSLGFEISRRGRYLMF